MDDPFAHVHVHPQVKPSALSCHDTHISGRRKPSLLPPTLLLTTTHGLSISIFTPAEWLSSNQCLTSALFNRTGATFFGSSGADTQLSHTMFPSEGHLKPEKVSEHNTVLSFHDGLVTTKYYSISRSRIHLATPLRKLKQIEPVCQLEGSACCLLWPLLYMGLKLNVK